MLLDLVVFIAGEERGLVQQAIRNAQFSDVVQQCGDIDRLEQRGVTDTGLTGEDQRITLDTLRMLICQPVVCRHGTRQCRDHRPRQIESPLPGVGIKTCCDIGALEIHRSAPTQRQ